MGPLFWICAISLHTLHSVIRWCDHHFPLILSWDSFRVLIQRLSPVKVCGGALIMWNEFGSKRYSGNWICDSFLCPSALNFLSWGSLISSTSMGMLHLLGSMARWEIGTSNGLPDYSSSNYHIIKGPYYRVIHIFLILAIFLKSIFDVLILVLF